MTALDLLEKVKAFLIEYHWVQVNGTEGYWEEPDIETLYTEVNNKIGNLRYDLDGEYY